MMSLAVVAVAVVVIAILGTLVHARAHDDFSPSVQDFAAFRATLAATERSDGAARP